MKSGNVVAARIARVYVHTESGTCETKAAPRTAAADADRLTRGPAYGHKTAGADRPADWPQYRGNALRSGVAGSAVPDAATSVAAAAVSPEAMAASSAERAVFSMPVAISEISFEVFSTSSACSSPR